MKVMLKKGVDRLRGMMMQMMQDGVIVVKDTYQAEEGWR